MEMSVVLQGLAWLLIWGLLASGEVVEKVADGRSISTTTATLAADQDGKPWLAITTTNSKSPSSAAKRRRRKKLRAGKHAPTGNHSWERSSTSDGDVDETEQEEEAEDDHHERDTTTRRRHKPRRKEEEEKYDKAESRDIEGGYRRSRQRSRTRRRRKRPKQPRRKRPRPSQSMDYPQFSMASPPVIRHVYPQQPTYVIRRVTPKRLFVLPRRFGLLDSFTREDSDGHQHHLDFGSFSKFPPPALHTKILSPNDDKMPCHGPNCHDHHKGLMRFYYKKVIYPRKRQPPPSDHHSYTVEYHGGGGGGGGRRPGPQYHGGYERPRGHQNHGNGGGHGDYYEYNDENKQQGHYSDYGGHDYEDHDGHHNQHR